MSLEGDVIAESLEDKSILCELNIKNTHIEKVEKNHDTPWLTQWTLHKVSIPDEKAKEIAEKISHALESEHPWYADFKNDKRHLIIYKNKVFDIDRTSYEDYKSASDYGKSLGIVDYQVDFTKNQVK